MALRPFKSSLSTTSTPTSTYEKQPFFGFDSVNLKWKKLENGHSWIICKFENKFKNSEHQSFISKTQEFSNLSIQNHSGKLAIVNQIYSIESKNVRFLVFLASNVPYQISNLHYSNQECLFSCFFHFKFTLSNPKKAAFRMSRWVYYWYLGGLKRT